MDGDVFAKRKQTHPVPCLDGESTVVTFDALELTALLDGLFGGGIDATGGLVEGEGRGAHEDTISAFQLYTTKPSSILLLFAIVVLPI